jgi:hypothetical protein
MKSGGDIKHKVKGGWENEKTFLNQKSAVILKAQNSCQAP